MAARFRIASKGRVGYIDAQGAIVIASELDDGGDFVDGLARAKKGGLWGFIDRDGSWALPPIYSDAGDFSEGLARVEILFSERGEEPRGEWGYIDSAGRVLSLSVRARQVADFHGGLARAEIGDKTFGYVRSDGTLAFSAAADSCEGFHEGRAVFATGGEWKTTSQVTNGTRYEQQELVPGSFGFWDEGGRVVIEPRFRDAGPFSQGLARVRQGGVFVERPYRYEAPGIVLTRTMSTLSGGPWGFVDRNGGVAIEPSFGWAGDFAEGLAPVYVGGRWGDEEIDQNGVKTMHHGLRGGAWGYADPSGGVAIAPRWDEASSHREGLARCRTGARWEFVDERGKTRIVARFEQAGDFRDGLARVTEAGRSGYVDRAGDWVFEEMG